MSEERFLAVYGKSARDLLAYFIRRTQTPEEAADCLAETFLVVWRKRDEIPSDPGQERPWVFGVARNVLRRVHERDRRRSDAVDALAAELRDTRAATPD
jgi:RNA polymerase sigma-70 factor (ECF subfamily)